MDSIHASHLTIMKHYILLFVALLFYTTALADMKKAQLALNIVLKKERYTAGKPIWLTLQVINQSGMTYPVAKPFYNKAGKSPYSFKIYEPTLAVYFPIIESVSLPSAQEEKDSLINLAPNDTVSFDFCINPSPQLPQSKKVWLTHALFFGKYTICAFYNPQGLLSNDPYFYLNDTETETKPTDKYMYAGGWESGKALLVIQNNSDSTIQFQGMEFIKVEGNHRYGNFKLKSGCFAATCITNDSLDLFVLVYSNYQNGRCGDLDFKLSYYSNRKVESIQYYRPNKCKGTTRHLSFDEKGNKIYETIEQGPNYSMIYNYENGVLKLSTWINIPEEKGLQTFYKPNGKVESFEIVWKCTVEMDTLDRK